VDPKSSMTFSTACSVDGNVRYASLTDCWAAGKESALPLKADMLCGGEKSPLRANNGPS